MRQKKRPAKAKKTSQKYQQQGHAASRGALIKAPYVGYEVRVRGRVLVNGQCTCSDKAKKIQESIKGGNAPIFLFFRLVVFTGTVGGPEDPRRQGGGGRRQEGLPQVCSPLP